MPTPAETATPSESVTEPELSKRDKRRDREAKKKQQTEQGDGPGTAEDGTEACNVCGEQFPSRTKLFDHVKKEGHMLAPGQGDGGKSKKGKKNKR